MMYVPSQGSVFLHIQCFLPNRAAGFGRPAASLWHQAGKPAFCIGVRRGLDIPSGQRDGNLQGGGKPIKVIKVKRG